VKRPIVLDSGALVAIERRRLQMVEILAAARSGENHIVIPVAILGEVWTGDGSRQAPIARVLSDARTAVHPLTLQEALAAGVLLRRTSRRIKRGKTRPGVIDAYVATCAQAVDAAAIVTSDPDDIGAFELDIPIIAI
jgi:predicted nucleic acid-binding protein